MENNPLNKQAQPSAKTEEPPNDEMAIRWHMAYDLLREIAAREQHIPISENARVLVQPTDK